MFLPKYQGIRRPNQVKDHGDGNFLCLILTLTKVSIQLSPWFSHQQDFLTNKIIRLTENGKIHSGTSCQ